MWIRKNTSCAIQINNAITDIYLSRNPLYKWGNETGYLDCLTEEELMFLVLKFPGLEFQEFIQPNEPI